jgi:FAD/FMN-containing dehydrogenase
MRTSGTAILNPPQIDALRRSFRGPLIGPDDDGYDEARKVWNASIDRRPLIIAKCSGTADVIAAVDFARTNHLLVAVRGGGHNVAGNAVCDGGIVIDLSGLKGVWVDPAARIARVQPGVTWGEFDREAQLFALATPGGLVSMTGVAGFTVGGGIGWLSRKHGAASDHLLSADVVTAEGRHVKASAGENEDLFWAVRGGGGNYGIVTSFEFRLHPVGPSILGGVIFYPGDKAAELLRILRDELAKAPDEFTAGCVLKLAPPAPFLPPTSHGAPVAILAVCHFGKPSDGVELLRPLFSLGEPLANLVGTRPYTEMQSLLDASWAPGFQNYWKAQYLAELPDTAIEIITSKAAKITSPLSDIKVIPMGGAFARFGEQDSALSHRNAAWIVNINSRWVRPDEYDRHVEWTRDLWSSVRPYSSGGVYLNFLGDEGADRVREAYGDSKYERLALLKRKYDPGNLFQLNQNIKPA